MTDDLVRRLREVATLRCMLPRGAPTGEYLVPKYVEGLAPEAVARALERMMALVEVIAPGRQLLERERTDLLDVFLAALAVPKGEII